MSHFTDELRVIRRGGWLATLLVYFLIVAGGTLAVQLDPEMGRWPLVGRIAFVVGMPILPALYILLVAYVNGDARRRGMRYALWTLLAFFVPYAIGIIVYFILRDPLPRPCPSCQTILPARYTFCPHCGTATTRICPNCGKPAERGWVNCAFCGTKLPAPEQKMETGK